MSFNQVGMNFVREWSEIGKYLSYKFGDNLSSYSKLVNLFSKIIKTTDISTEHNGSAYVVGLEFNLMNSTSIL